VVWLQRLTEDPMKKSYITTTILIDNKSAIQLCKNPIFHDRSKYIEFRFHFICKCIEASKISVNYVRTGEQLADILTKPLRRTKFLKLRAKIGMVDVKSNN
jgi:hypothetical protein